MHLASLHIYPVKSLRGLSVESAEIDALGAVDDRRFMVTDAEGRFATQRTMAKMARIWAFIEGAELVLRSEGFGEVRIGHPPDPRAALVPVTVWKSEVQAEDCGAEPSAWLSRVIGAPCKLVRIGPACVRPVQKAAAEPGDLVSFADAAPLLVTNTGSLADLNDRILEAGGEAVPMDRFRPNIVVAGAEPFAEDQWKRIRIGGVVLRSAGPCARCIVTTTDQETGIRGHEPLRTLATFRRNSQDPTYVNFGQNLVNESKVGILRVGDSVEILE